MARPRNWKCQRDWHRLVLSPGKEKKPGAGAHNRARRRIRDAKVADLITFLRRVPIELHVHRTGVEKELETPVCVCCSCLVQLPPTERASHLIRLTRRTFRVRHFPSARLAFVTWQRQLCGFWLRAYITHPSSAHIYYLLRCSAMKAIDRCCPADTRSIGSIADKTRLR